MWEWLVTGVWEGGVRRRVALSSLGSRKHNPLVFFRARASSHQPAAA
jgi:hypothetical protein